MKRIECGAIVVLAALALAAVACGQPLTTAEETQTAQAGSSTAATTVPDVTRTPTVATAMASPAVSTPSSPPQDLAEATPIEVTPITGGATARTDCLAGFATFRDVTGSVSLCGPNWLRAVSGVNNVGSPGITVSTPDDALPSVPRVALAARITPVRKFRPSATPSPLCNYDAVAEQTSIEEVHLNVAGVSGEACHAVGETHSPQGSLELIDFSGALPQRAGEEPRYLSFTLTWRTDSVGARELAYQMIDSIALP